MSSMFSLQRPVRALALLSFMLSLLPLPAAADLMLNPTRVVFSKNQRAAQIELINNGNEASTYRISLVNRRMGESGDFTPADVAGPGELFADAMLRFSPRQVTLLPGTSQVVRIMVRKPAVLADGEYRSHLRFERLPDVKGSTSIENSAQGKNDIGVVLTTLIGASIPVIVRHGATEAAVTLSALALQRPAGAADPVLAFQIMRSGNSSVYGDLVASFTPQGGAELPLAKASGVAVYAPNPLRRASLALKAPPGVNLARGSLRLRFHDRPEAGGKIMAEAQLALP